MEPVPSPDVDRLRPFTVGDWLVEPKACHATRGHIQLKLRPQLVDLLVCLVRRAGEIVLKDEILADVWPGQYIAESGLSRCIAELRQFLGDDAQDPRYIETIPKRGYRLIAPVAWVSPAPQERAIPPGALVEPDQPQRPTGTASPPPEAAPRHRRDRRWLWRLAAWAAVATAAAAMAGLGVGWLDRSPAVVLSERDAVLLADVNNATGDSVFDDTLRLALAVELQQAPFLRILPDEAVRAAVARMGRPPDTRVVGAVALDACRREGASVLLAASIAPLGSRYAVGIEAIACGSGEAVTSALVEAEGQERVIEALERAARNIRQKLGESRASLREHDVPLEQATTPSLDALRALTLGDKYREQARLADALTLYRQATEIDPGFALAWARRGAVARNLGLRDEMVPAFRRAYDLRDRVTQPERFYIEAHYVADSDPEQAIEVFRAWKRMYPGSYIPPNNLAALLSGQMGQYDAALAEAREAVRLAPGNSVAHRTLVLACLGTGRLDEARNAIAAAAARGIDDPHMRRLALKLVLLDDDPAALEREADKASGDPMAELDIWRLRALAAMVGGRLSEARRLWSTTLERTSQTGLEGRIVEMRLSQAEAEALLGDHALARQAVHAALTADPTPPTLVTSAIVLALIGEPVRARAILDDVARTPAPDTRALKVWLPSAQALVQALQGHADRALALWQPVARLARGSDQALVPLGVGALVEVHAHRPSNAAAVFGDLIALRAIEPASPWVAFARLELARALREMGDVSGSLVAYDAFLESWKGADPDAPLLGVARRERGALADSHRRPVMTRARTVLVHCLLLLAATAAPARAQDARQAALASLDARAATYATVSQQIWEWAEVGYQEVRSSALLQDQLRAAGFAIEAGVAGMPTAFVASYGRGKPVVAILAEFDALPGITQDRVPERRIIDGKAAGHACGHHLFGTGSTAAAIAVREWLERSGSSGTVRVYGTPAEEGGAGKVYMVRDGLFADVDIALHWHPGDRNDASPGQSLANKSAKFRFRGVSAHAAAAPDRGRSALDGVEAMNDMVNLMREHVPQETRIHYVITNGGAAPNVVPDIAEVYYYVRHPNPTVVSSLFDRVVRASEGAAMGTDTTVEHEVIHGLYALLPNDTLARAMDRNLREVGGVSYEGDERAFAESIRQSFDAGAPPLARAADIEPFEMKDAGGSTDVADVSWVVPTAGVRVATWVPGTPGHSWQAIAAGGTSIGIKGMMNAARTLTLTAIDLFTDPTLIAEATAEYKKRVGPDFVYRPLVGNRPPPLDYRK